MNIENPIEINFTGDVDYSQGEYMAQRLILTYMDYLKGIAETLEMEITTDLIAESNLDENDNDLLNRHFPLFHIQVKDDDEILGEFIYSEYSIALYERFREWIMIDILFYMKSKMLYREFDIKLPDKVKVKQSFKAKI